MLKWETVSGANWEEMRLYLSDSMWFITHEENDTFFRIKFRKKGKEQVSVAMCVAKTRLEAQIYVRNAIVRSIDVKIDKLRSLRKEVEKIETLVVKG